MRRIDLIIHIDTMETVLQMRYAHRRWSDEAIELQDRIEQLIDSLTTFYGE